MAWGILPISGTVAGGTVVEMTVTDDPEEFAYIPLLQEYFTPGPGPLFVAVDAVDVTDSVTVTGDYTLTFVTPAHAAGLVAIGLFVDGID